jgi:hypothetical protein
MVVPRLRASTTLGFDFSSLFFSDGSKGGRVPVLVYFILVVSSPACGREPSGVFTSEMSATFVALIQIRSRPPGRYLIVTNSMSSLKALQTRRVAPRTHSLIYAIK